MIEPVWLRADLVNALHDAQLAEHGGLAGLRDAGLLDAALARPKHMFAFGETDLTVLAAAYAFAILRNHPYIDGNKRAALLTLYVFLKRNGLQFEASEVDTAIVVLQAAAGEIDEPTFAAWVRRNTTDVS